MHPTPINASEHHAISASLSVRNPAPDLIGLLKRRAAAHGRSAEAEMRWPPSYAR